MLKSQVGRETWLVHQPDHARVSGYVAAHWGNGEFTCPGYFADSDGPEQLRQSVVQAVAEHDNGWWEWEASPDIDAADDLPLHLSDVARVHQDAGLRRWRTGVPRLMEKHPYAALLISQHASWLYAFDFPDLPDLNDAFRHPLFGRPGTANRLTGNEQLIRAFLEEQRALQRAVIDRIRSGPVARDSVEPGHLFPHVRLLQLMDALSLLLCFGGQQELTLEDVPRRNWDDRITLEWKPTGGTRISCRPFPFDQDPLEVFLPVRVIDGTPPSHGLPLTRLHATPLISRRFEIVSTS